ncbi:CPXCG motif-containing cysteine-rich protein [Seongchinamella unica]|uniref:CPXCG motif-containing cysteine-rich protein n=1 Tax=Seongchinamella unica TaxID=2547392 RepID=A0A4V2ZX13_9GAMM|nr:CPXCG motif-containing cysteine-rich protein [Seongchinamella unica]TDG12593.1 CPXCG motif-containing cysteine-rich protein [Seongchinamella unica]
MESLEEISVNCPYCGEAITVLVDSEEAGQQYVEDCQVCCRPITFSVSTGFDGQLLVAAYDENEAF